jgi:hypothetical protein
MINNLVDFLERFKRYVPKDRLLRSAVVQAIQDEIGHEISSKGIRTQGDAIWIQASGVLRQEIQRRHEKLLVHINQQLPTGSIIRAIRFW